MRRHSLTRIFVITLTILFAIATAALAQEAGTDQPKKKQSTTTTDPATQTAPAAAQESGKAQAKKKKPHLTTDAATQTAPATQSQPGSQKGKSGEGKGNAPKDPKDAGWVTVHGRILTVQADQKIFIIQTDSKQYQIHVTAQTKIQRDGQPADLNALKTNDRVDSCHFNAKHVAQTLQVTSAENVLKIPPPKQ